jgi:hypothetical protein
MPRHGKSPKGPYFEPHALSPVPQSATDASNDNTGGVQGRNTHFSALSDKAGTGPGSGTGTGNGPGAAHSPGTSKANGKGKGNGKGNGSGSSSGIGASIAHVPDGPTPTSLDGDTGAGGVVTDDASSGRGSASPATRLTNASAAATPEEGRTSSHHPSAASTRNPSPQRDDEPEPDAATAMPQNLRHSASNTAAQEALHKLSWALIEPSFFCWTRLWALLSPTPDHRKHSLVGRLFALPLLLLALLTFPVALVALPFYLLSHRHRRSFVYHTRGEVRGERGRRKGVLLTRLSLHPSLPSHLHHFSRHPS